MDRRGSEEERLILGCIENNTNNKGKKKGMLQNQVF